MLRSRRPRTRFRPYAANRVPRFGRLAPAGSYFGLSTNYAGGGFCRHGRRPAPPPGTTHALKLMSAWKRACRRQLAAGAEGIRHTS